MITSCQPFLRWSSAARTGRTTWRALCRDRATRKRPGRNHICSGQIRQRPTAAAMMITAHTPAALRPINSSPCSPSRTPRDLRIQALGHVVHLPACEFKHRVARTTISAVFEAESNVCISIAQSHRSHQLTAVFAAVALCTRSA